MNINITVPINKNTTNIQVNLSNTQNEPSYTVEQYAEEQEYIVNAIHTYEVTGNNNHAPPLNYQEMT